MHALTFRQRLFVSYYLGTSGGNAADAARKAGYRWPDKQGSQLLGKTRVRAAIDAKLESVAMGQDEVLARLSDVASGSLEWFIDVTANGFKVNLKRAERAGAIHLVKKIREGKCGVEIELHDPLTALIQLGKFYGLGERDPVPVVSTLEIVQEAARRAAERKQGA
jgi:phage terminase small subunit